ncbi:MAG: flavodoxin [Treponemataceae bacterium]
MSNVAIVYWSGTGNTEQMAEAIKTGASDAGATVSVFTASEFDEGKMDEFDSVAFGCPAMGNEELEEAEFAPMFDACKSKLKGKKIALFGSYSWADGEWMRLWEAECKDLGAVLAADPVICFEAPDDQGVSDCKALGAALV